MQAWKFLWSWSFLWSILRSVCGQCGQCGQLMTTKLTTIDHKNLGERARPFGVAGEARLTFVETVFDHVSRGVPVSVVERN